MNKIYSAFSDITNTSGICCQKATDAWKISVTVKLNVSPSIEHSVYVSLNSPVIKYPLFSVFISKEQNFLVSTYYIYNLNYKWKIKKNKNGLEILPLTQDIIIYFLENVIEHKAEKTFFEFLKCYNIFCI